MPSHGIAYDTWAGIVNVATDEDGFAYLPEHVSIGINAGPLYGALGIMAGVMRARATGRGLPPRDRPVRRCGRRRLAAQRDLEGLRASRERGHRQQGRRLRAPCPGDRGHEGGGPLPGLRGERWPLRAVHGFGAGILAQLLPGRGPDGSLRALARVQVRRPRTRQPGAPAGAASDLWHPDGRGVDRFRRQGQHAHRPRQHATNAGLGPRNSRPASPGCRPASSAPTSSRARSNSPRGDLPHPTEAPTLGQHNEAVLRSVLGYDDNRITAARDGGAFGADASADRAAKGRT